MPMRPRLLTRHALCVELGAHERTLARRLRNVPPDGEVNGRPAWFISTAIKAVGSTKDGNGGASEAVLDEIQDLASALDAGLRRVQSEKDLEARRRMLREDVGRLVGQLDKAMALATEGVSARDRALLDVVRNHVIGTCAGEVLALGNWCCPELGDLELDQKSSIWGRL
jgi:hypothetical protein